MPDELPNVPLVKFPGALYDNYAAGYKWGQELNARFPDAEAENFAEAVSSNSHPFGDSPPAIAKLVCTQVGERDEGDWVWLVSLENGETWKATGWCDYTGWDCQSALEWDQVPTP